MPNPGMKINKEIYQEIILEIILADRETPAHLILFYPAIFLPGNKTETITSKQRQKTLHEFFDSSKN